MGIPADHSFFIHQMQQASIANADSQFEIICRHGLFQHLPVRKFVPGFTYPGVHRFLKVRFRFCSQPKLAAYEFINTKNDDQPCQHFQQQVQPYDIFMRVTTEDMLHEPPPQSLPPIAGFGNRFHRIIECRIVTVLL